jgi:hypothetical protein
LIENNENTGLVKKVRSEERGGRRLRFGQKPGGGTPNHGHEQAADFLVFPIEGSA